MSRAVAVAAAALGALVAACGGQGAAPTTGGPGTTGSVATSPAVEATGAPPTEAGAAATQGAGGTAGGASIHLVITGGSHPGTYDVATGKPCKDEGGGGWSLSAFSNSSAAADIASIDVAFGTPLDAVTVGFGDDTGYLALGLPFELTGSATAPTITASGPVGDSSGLGGNVGTVELRVDCGTSGPRETPYVPPTPAILGPAPAGATVFHVTIGFGAWAGTYDAWTTDPACIGGEGTLSASVVNALGIPPFVSLSASSIEGLADPVGSAHVVFGQGSGFTVYDTSRTATIELSPTGTAHVTDTVATSTTFDQGHATGSLELSLTCASVGGF
jgi:hypothetical protein